MSILNLLSSPKAFPAAIIALQACAAIRWAFCRATAPTVYGACAALLGVAVTFGNMSGK